MSRSNRVEAPPGRTTYHHGDLRQALIAAGREVLEERGVDGLSLREVARRAQVSQAAPYHHFTDKAALVAALVERGFADFAAAMLEAAESVGGSAFQRLTGMGLAYVRFAVANPAVFRLLFRPELRGKAGEGPAALVMEQAALASYRVFFEGVKAAVAEGSIQGSVDDVALTAWSAVHGLSTLILDGPVEAAGRSPDELAAAVLVVLGVGMSSGWIG